MFGVHLDMEARPASLSKVHAVEPKRASKAHAVEHKTHSTAGFPPYLENLEFCHLLVQNSENLEIVYLTLKGIVHLNIIFSYMKVNKICNLDHPVY